MKYPCGSLLSAISFFKDSSANGGMQHLVSHLRIINGLNNRNATNPNNRAPVYQVEDAMELTLKDQGMIVPAGTLQSIGRNFMPSGPPRYRIIGQ